MVNFSRFRRLSVTFSVVVLCFAQPQHDPILAHIKKTWGVLTRSNHTLATAAADPKFHASADGRWPVYVSRNEDLRRIEQQLRRELPATDLAKLELRPLPANTAELREPGLLYLPHAYVVPGGRFNEIYGWIAISSRSVCFATARSTWRRAWLTTSCSRSASTARS